MKIVFLTSNTSLYGANRSLLALINGLSVKHQVICVTPDEGEFYEELKVNGIPVKRVAFSLSHTTNKHRNLLFLIRALLRKIKQVLSLYRFISKEKADLIYTNTSVIDQGLIVSKLLKKPHVWHIREFGDLDYNLFPDLGDRYFKYILKQSDALIAISKSISRHVLSHIDERKKTVIYNGVISREAYKSYTLNKRVTNKISFGLVGLISENKGHEKAIKAFSKLKSSNLILNFFGDGKPEYVKYLVDFVHKYGLDEVVRFRGFQKNINDIYNEIDVLLMCSSNEAMGRVVAEAMVRGIPVIANNSGAIPELIENNISGLIYVDDQELTKQMENIANNPELRVNLGNEARKRSESKFLHEVYITDVESVLNGFEMKK